MNFQMHVYRNTLYMCPSPSMERIVLPLILGLKWIALALWAWNGYECVLCVHSSACSWLPVRNIMCSHCRMPACNRHLVWMQCHYTHFACAFADFFRQIKRKMLWTAIHDQQMPCALASATLRGSVDIFIAWLCSSSSVHEWTMHWARNVMLSHHFC